MEDCPKGLSGKLWFFTIHPLTGLAVGVLLGAITVAVSLKYIFLAAGLIIVPPILKTGFFQDKPKLAKFFGNAVLCALVWIILFVLWKIIPPPKEPASPAEIADAVIKREGKGVETSREIPPQQGGERDIPTTPPAQKHPSPKSPTQPPPPQAAKLTVTQKPDVSTREDAPYKTLVTVQSNVEFPTLKMLVQCNKPLVYASGGPTGMILMTNEGLVPDHPNLYFLSYQSANPPFGPSNPVVVGVWSKEPVICDQAATY